MRYVISVSRSKVPNRAKFVWHHDSQLVMVSFPKLKVTKITIIMYNFRILSFFNVLRTKSGKSNTFKDN